MPNTKINVIDIGAKEYLAFYGKDGWHRETTHIEMGPDNLYNLYEFFPQTLTQPYGYCDIQGGDKPKITRRDDIYYARAVEHIDHAKQSNPDVLKNYFGTLNEELRTNKHWFNDGDISNRCIGILSEEYCLGA